MKRVTSKRASNFGWRGGTVRPGETVSLPDEVAATLNPREWEFHHHRATAGRARNA